MSNENAVKSAQYYVYMYLDINNTPFYIGKGKIDRYRVSSHLGQSDNNLLKNKIRKVGIKNIKLHFFHKNISEEESFRWERYWIKYIGRRDLKQGTLCNLTDGGEGISGRIVSKETRRKISSANKGRRSPNKNKKLSENHKRKISTSLKGNTSPNKGKPMTEVQKQKIRKALKNNIPWNKDKILGPLSEETKRKISKANKGRKHTEVTKQKMRDVRKRRL